MPLVASEDDGTRPEPGLVLEAQLEARLRAGSYAELEAAIAAVRAEEPRGVRAWREWMTVEPWEGAWDREPVVSAVEVKLLRRMPARIRVPADVRYAWEHRHVHARQAESARAKGRHANEHRRRRRDQQIRELYAGGHGLPSDVLAERFGISARQVRSIVRG